MRRSETGGFRDLDVWKVAIELAVDVYSLTRSLPATERYELASQMRRSAVSIAANIAEGNGRDHTRDHLHFLAMARGSLNELDTEIEIASRLGYLSPQQLTSTGPLIQRVGMMLTRLRQNLQNRLPRAGRP